MAAQKSSEKQLELSFAGKQSLLKPFGFERSLVLKKTTLQSNRPKSSGNFSLAGFYRLIPDLVLC